jgi:acyl-CoA thioesterase-1
LKTLLTYVLPLFIVGLLSCQKGSLKPTPNALGSVNAPSDSVRVNYKIVILGSSTAEGTGAIPIDSSWANKLKQKSRSFSVMNLSVGGYETYLAMPTGELTLGKPAPDTAHNITKTVAQHPDLVIMSFPSNDIARNYTDEEIIKNYRRLTSILEIANIPYLIFGTQPRNFSSMSQRLRLKVLNDKLKTIYLSNYYDFLAAMSTPSYEIIPDFSFGDGIHLNNKGHNLIFTGLLSTRQIQKIIK